MSLDCHQISLQREKLWFIISGANKQHWVSNLKYLKRTWFLEGSISALWPWLRKTMEYDLKHTQKHLNIYLSPTDINGTEVHNWVLLEAWFLKCQVGHPEMEVSNIISQLRIPASTYLNITCLLDRYGGNVFSFVSLLEIKKLIFEVKSNNWFIFTTGWMAHHDSAWLNLSCTRNRSALKYVVAIHLIRIMWENV